MTRRRVRQIILVLYAAALVGMAGMVIGPFLNDRAINANPGRALATVTDVGRLRTFVDFQDGEGIYHSPPTGLLYPTGLGEGQQVWVLYAKNNPDLVKVEGREWTISIIPGLSSALVATLIAAALWWGSGKINRNLAHPLPTENSDKE
ncbi:DUF3592 domain-containing protein [Corynebacterium minutissimum]|uniref:DUF3592 domain-containing protein n=1 Tax=Corynebacterium minutissimum TaxID=38301 RepID=UPI002F26DE50